MNLRRLAVLIFAFGCSAAAAAETLYAASVRSPVNEGSLIGVTGSLPAKLILLGLLILVGIAAVAFAVSRRNRLN
jgi:hypothetical protein